jgi:hypothetical protein
MNMWFPTQRSHEDENGILGDGVVYQGSVTVIKASEFERQKYIYIYIYRRLKLGGGQAYDRSSD